MTNSPNRSTRHLSMTFVVTLLVGMAIILWVGLQVVLPALQGLATAASTLGVQ